MKYSNYQRQRSCSEALQVQCQN